MIAIHEKLKASNHDQGIDHDISRNQPVGVNSPSTGLRINTLQSNIKCRRSQSSCPVTYDIIAMEKPNSSNTSWQISRLLPPFDDLQFLLLLLHQLPLQDFFLETHPWAKN